jgi:hypothetical protein
MAMGMKVNLLAHALPDVYVRSRENLAGVEDKRSRPEGEELHQPPASYLATLLTSLAE